MKIKSPKDFWAGLMFIAFGTFFMVIALKNYQFGAAVRMGPGYFPTVLGGLLAVLGLAVLSSSLVVEGPAVPRFHLRPNLMIALGLVAYGYLMRPLGLILSTAVLVFISALGGHEFKWKEVALLTVALIVISVLVFVKGLTLPFPIWPALFA